MIVDIHKRVRLPYKLALERYRKTPELGPRILFFSGGSALGAVSRVLTAYTHNSIHIITPFDSGGSSAVLRKAFSMPAIGDVRNRLLALSDRSIKGNPEVERFFKTRLSGKMSGACLANELDMMIMGHHPLVAQISDPMNTIIRHYLELFRKKMPPGFDLKKASIGNLILTSGYLDSQRRFDSVIYIFSKLVSVLGLVRPVVNRDLHLAAVFEDGRKVVGQHRFTGKESPPVEAKIEKVFLTEALDSEEEVRVDIKPKIEKLIQSADTICYPFGSFYSSLVANLLPRGVARAIQSNPCPKIFIPNTFADPECYGMSVPEMVDVLLSYLKKDSPHVPETDLLNFVIMDSGLVQYHGAEKINFLEKRGVRVIKYPIVSRRSYPGIDEEVIAEILLSFAL